MAETVTISKQYGCNFDCKKEHASELYRLVDSIENVYELDRIVGETRKLMKDPSANGGGYHSITTQIIKKSEEIEHPGYNPMMIHSFFVKELNKRKLPNITWKPPIGSTE